jgi:hypothetical protein
VPQTRFNAIAPLSTDTDKLLFTLLMVIESFLESAALFGFTGCCNVTLEVKLTALVVPVTFAILKSTSLRDALVSVKVTF